MNSAHNNNNNSISDSYIGYTSYLFLVIGILLIMVWFNGYSYTVVQCLNVVILFELVHRPHQFWIQKMIKIHRTNVHYQNTKK